MRTLGEIVDLVCSQLNKTDAVSKTLCRKFARQRHGTIYDTCLWRESLWLKSFTVKAAATSMIFPKYVDLLIGLRYGTTTIFPVNQEVLFMTDPNIFEQTSTPLTYTEGQRLATEASANGEKLVLVSSDAGDTAVKVKIYGEYQGAEVRETLTMTGTTPKTSTKNYDYVYSIGKSEDAVAVGDIAITNNVTLTALLTLWAEEKSVSCARIFFYPVPTADTTALSLFKRKARELVDDADTPALSHMEDCLIAFTRGDMLRRMKQYAKANDSISEAGTMLQNMKNLHEYQKANLPRLQPMGGATQYAYPSRRGTVRWYGRMSK